MYPLQPPPQPSNPEADRVGWLQSVLTHRLSAANTFAVVYLLLFPGLYLMATKVLTTLYVRPGMSLADAELLLGHNPVAFWKTDPKETLCQVRMYDRPGIPFPSEFTVVVVDGRVTFADFGEPQHAEEILGLRPVEVPIIWGE